MTNQEAVRRLRSLPVGSMESMEAITMACEALEKDPGYLDKDGKQEE